MSLHPGVFQQAGVQARHLRGMVPVARTTISLWLNGKQQPSHFVIDGMMSIQHAVSQALADGRLPLPDSVPSGQHRDRRIVAVIREYMGQAATTEEDQDDAETA